jgi:hypothetical protein
MGPLALGVIELRRAPPRGAAALVKGRRASGCAPFRNTYIGDEPGNSSSLSCRSANASSKRPARPSLNAAMLSEGSLKS